MGLINDVLDMSKIESGNIVINLEHVSLPSILENVVAIMQPTVKERKQQFDVRLLHVEHEELFSDPLRLRQIFINILSNASKFTPEGGKITFEVEELSCEMPESSLFRFTFSDTGMGIKPEFLPYLFDAFTRERDSRVDKTEGSGLGLAITHKLTELFGGTISVKSQLGEGTTFCVELPLKIDSLGWEPISCEGLKVLVVDNDIDVCKHLAQTLAELGAEALWCWNGADAVKTVAQERLSGQSFNLVLLDWQMPGMDGVQTSLAIRRQADADVPILITSAYDWVDIEAEAKKVLLVSTASCKSLCLNPPCAQEFSVIWQASCLFCKKSPRLNCRADGFCSLKTICLIEKLPLSYCPHWAHRWRLLPMAR